MWKNTTLVDGKIVLPVFQKKTFNVWDVYPIYAGGHKGYLSSQVTIRQITN